jgi:hypothetical protein
LNRIAADGPTNKCVIDRDIIGSYVKAIVTAMFPALPEDFNDQLMKVKFICRKMP